MMSWESQIVREIITTYKIIFNLDRFKNLYTGSGKLRTLEFRINAEKYSCMKFISFSESMMQVYYSTT